MSKGVGLMIGCSLTSIVPIIISIYKFVFICLHSHGHTVAYDRLFSCGLGLGSHCSLFGIVKWVISHYANSTENYYAPAAQRASANVNAENAMIPDTMIRTSIIDHDPRSTPRSRSALDQE